MDGEMPRVCGDKCIPEDHINPVVYFILKNLVLWARSEAIGFAFCKMQR